MPEVLQGNFQTRQWAGAHEALFVDDAGFLLEGATSNVFVVRAGVLHTPEARGILPGITRDSLICLARDLGFTVEGGRVSVDGLLDADEASRLGLIELIADEPTGLIEALLAASPHSIRESKKFVRRVLDGQHEDDEETLRLFAEAFTGSDFLEGTTAFVEKRKPEFGS